MNFAGRKTLEESLGEMVAKEIGKGRWKRILSQLAEVEKSTGSVLRMWPRRTQRGRTENDDRYPVQLFAPDRDKEAREFDSVVGAKLLYIGHNSDHEDVYEYAAYAEDDIEWWRGLSNQRKGLVISVLSYILRASGDSRTIVEFPGKKW